MISKLHCASFAALYMISKTHCALYNLKNVLCKLPSAFLKKQKMLTSLRDKILFGKNDETARQRMLEKEDLTSETAVNICRSVEV